ncbi:MAG: MarR family transcriptional regulator [Rhizomicrobium sp.]|nr:MarR family transcriptional regulator [Rhizomicrobium sp.]
MVQAQNDKPSRSPSLTSIGFLLHRAQSRLREGVVAAIEGSGLHPGQLAILGVLSDKGPLSQRALAEASQIEKSSLVLFLDTLERDGWLYRDDDPEDRRAHLVKLTPKGKTKFSVLGLRLQKAQDAFLAPISKAEHAQLIELLLRLGGPT